MQDWMAKWELCPSGDVESYTSRTETTQVTTGVSSMLCPAFAFLHETRPVDVRSVTALRRSLAGVTPAVGQNLDWRFRRAKHTVKETTGVHHVAARSPERTAKPKNSIIRSSKPRCVEDVSIWPANNRLPMARNKSWNCFQLGMNIG